MMMDDVSVWSDLSLMYGDECRLNHPINTTVYSKKTTISVFSAHEVKKTHLLKTCRKVANTTPVHRRRLSNSTEIHLFERSQP